MTAKQYVTEVHKAVGRIKEAHELGVLSSTERNASFRARTETITNLAIIDPEIGSEDFVIICKAIEKACDDLEHLIF